MRPNLDQLQKNGMVFQKSTKILVVVVYNIKSSQGSYFKPCSHRTISSHLISQWTALDGVRCPVQFRRDEMRWDEMSDVKAPLHPANVR